MMQVTLASQEKTTGDTERGLGCLLIQLVSVFPSFPAIIWSIAGNNEGAEQLRVTHIDVHGGCVLLTNV